MKVKKEIDAEEVERIKGSPSLELTDNCPDLRHAFPSVPCTNRGCEYSIKEPRYMNCTFFASEAGSHTLEAIGKMMGITREGARIIERRALKKIQAHFSLDGSHGPPERSRSLLQQNHTSGEGDISSEDRLDEREDEADSLPAHDD